MYIQYANCECELFRFPCNLEIKNIEAFTIRQNEKGKILKGKITTFDYKYLIR